MCLPMIWLMRRLSQVPGVSSQSAAGVVLTFGFALGYFLNKWFSPLPLKVDSFLSGSVLNVSRVDVVAVGVVLVLTVLALMVAGRFLIFYSFDPLGYRASGLRPAWAEGTVMLMITLTIVMLVPAVGTILPSRSSPRRRPRWHRGPPPCAGCSWRPRSSALPPPWWGCWPRCG